MDLKRKNYQRNSSWNAPYTFSGKEKDVETGYGYFGARYYDSGLSIWLSVDPMSDKYPSMSPYNYCANNPVMLVDPDGREIWIFFEGNKIRYENNKLYNTDGTDYTGEVSGFLAETFSALNTIRSVDDGLLVADLEQQDGFNVEIRANSKSTTNEQKEINPEDLSQSFIGANIGWNSNGTIVPTFGDFENGKCAISGLAHELSHGLDMKQNVFNTAKYDGVMVTDYIACYRENIIREKLHKPLRTHYLITRDPEFGNLIGTGPSMVRGRPARPYLREF